MKLFTLFSAGTLAALVSVNGFASEPGAGYPTPNYQNQQPGYDNPQGYDYQGGDFQGGYQGGFQGGGSFQGGFQGGCQQGGCVPNYRPCYRQPCMPNYRPCYRQPCMPPPIQNCPPDRCVYSRPGEPPPVLPYPGPQAQPVPLPQPGPGPGYGAVCVARQVGNGMFQIFLNGMQPAYGPAPYPNVQSVADHYVNIGVCQRILWQQ